MKEFMFIIRGGDEHLQGASAEYMQEHMGKWQAWMGGLAEKGLLVGGQPLESPGMTLIDNGAKVIDRPLAEGKELVGGYIILKANTLEEGVDLARACPGLVEGCTMEVREIKQMP